VLPFAVITCVERHNYWELSLCWLGMYFGENDERVPKEMRGIGIRVEDNILITEDGYENLTSALPSSANEIEALLNDS